ncbi:MAG: glycosyltransferase [Pseudomonadota bacterium]
MEASSQAGIASVQKVLAVIVVYNCHWDAVVAAGYLLRQLERATPQAPLQLDRLVIYDNSPLPMAAPAAPHARIDYRHDPGNGGTRGAYDYALQQAGAGGQAWLLLLDQDTLLPDNYLQKASEACAAHPGRQVDLLFPRVEDAGRCISPGYVTRLGSVAPVAKGALPGDTARRGLTGIASGSMVRAAAWRKIAPLPPQLWLDYVDHWIFHQMNLGGASGALVDATLQHKLSILNMAEVSRQRLDSILDGERLFMRSLGLPARLAYPVRLLLRLARLRASCPPAASNMLAWLSLRFAR